MFNFNRTKAFSIIAAVILLTPMLVSARVYFLDAPDESAGSEDPTRPCILDYPYRICPDGKKGQNPCPTDGSYFQTCGCDTDVYKFDASNCKDNKTLGANTCNNKSDTCSCDVKYQYTTANCTGGKALSGNTCDGKYETCGCPAEYSKTCSTGNLIPTDANDSCDGKYKACKCPTSYGTCTGSGQAGGAPGSAQCTEEDGTVKYASCKAEVNCEAPYYKNAEGSCVLWDDVAAVAKTCNDLITATKNANLQGNILVWGTLNCQENEIKIPVGQNIVGRGYYKGKYTEATDAEQNKFSKITWNFQTIAGFGLSVEHNTKLSDLTLEIKSNQNSQWIDWVSFNATPGLILVNTKQNLVFRNLDLKADMSTVESKGVNLIEGNAALTGSFTFEGSNYMTFLNKKLTNSDGNTYAANSSTYFTKLVNMNIGQDAKLTILGDNGGAYYGVFHTKTNLTKNAHIYFKQTNTTSWDSPGFKDYTLNDSPICKITMKDTAKIDFDFNGSGYPMYFCSLDMHNSSVINANSDKILYGSVGITRPQINLYNNATINFVNKNPLLWGNTSYSYYGNTPIGSVDLTMNDSSIIRINALNLKDVDIFDYTQATLNGNSRLVVKVSCREKTHQSHCSWWGRGITMNGNSKFFYENNQDMFAYIEFKLNSTSARIYARQTNSSSPTKGAIFGNRSYSGFDSVMTSVSGAQFYLEATGQTSINGVYTMPVVSSKKISSAYDCQYNNAPASKCYSNDMITLLGATKSTSMTSTYKAEFDSEISAMVSNQPSF